MVDEVRRGGLRCGLHAGQGAADRLCWGCLLGRVLSERDAGLMRIACSSRRRVACLGRLLRRMPVRRRQAPTGL